MDEIERKYLIKIPDQSSLAGYPHHLIIQGYLSIDPEIRVRRCEKIGLFPDEVPVITYTLCCKRGRGLHRMEIETEIPMKTGESLLRDCSSKVTKNRWNVGGWDIDVYSGSLNGLMVAEAELKSITDPVPEEPPGIILLKEVTGLTCLSNAALSRMTEHEAVVFVKTVMNY